MARLSTRRTVVACYENHCYHRTKEAVIGRRVTSVHNFKKKDKALRNIDAVNVAGCVLVGREVSLTKNLTTKTW